MYPGYGSQASVETPMGATAIYNALRQIYPDQLNPLQVSALVKYWLKGPDPLDYISMYENKGNLLLGIPPHWHYISCGLSDLHGDGRVHEVSEQDGPSGFGFELTFRLKRAPEERSPPTWPAQLMQNLAKYVFRSDVSLCSGDHVSWHTALDLQHSFIEQMFITDDPQLPSLTTPFGYVNFLQIVGVCTEELQAAQHWNGPAVINLLKQIPEAGGHWLVTDMLRTNSIFHTNPRLREFVEIGIDQDGSNLSGVSAHCWWSECSKQTIHDAAEGGAQNHGVVPAEQPSSSNLTMRIRTSLANYRNEARSGGSNRSDEYNSVSRMSNYSCVSDLLTARPINEGLQLRFNLEAAMLLPLAIRGRLAHGRHFTFNSVSADCAMTFVSTDVTGTSVDERFPYATLKNWLQILVPDAFLEQLAHDFEELQHPEELCFPRIYAWPDRNLMITVVKNSSN